MGKHLAAAKAAGGAEGLLEYFNFGTGTGSTVLELVAAMEKASGKKVEVVWGARRDGDLAEAYADITKVRSCGQRLAAGFTRTQALTRTHTHHTHNGRLAPC
jgi:UDP-glucose 4-epimerase